MRILMRSIHGIPFLARMTSGSALPEVQATVVASSTLTEPKIKALFEY